MPACAGIGLIECAIVVAGMLGRGWALMMSGPLMVRLQNRDDVMIGVNESVQDWSKDEDGER